MTKREAVEILRHADTDSEVDTDDYLKAFDMAVNALKREVDIDNYITDLQKSVAESVRQIMHKIGIKTEIEIEPQTIDWSALDISRPDLIELAKRESQRIEVKLTMTELLKEQRRQ